MVPILLVCTSLLPAPFGGWARYGMGPPSAWAEEANAAPEGGLDFEKAVFTRNGQRAALFAPGGPPGRVTTDLTMVDFSERTQRAVAGLHTTGSGSWSPDGRWFATSSRTEDAWTAVLVDSKTLAWAPVGPRNAHMWNPGWRPDGRALLLNTPSAVYLTRPGEDEARSLGDGTTFRCVNPYWQGRWLVSRVVREAQTLEYRLRHPTRHRFYVLDDAGDAEEVLPNRFVESIVVSPDGQRAAAFCWPLGVTAYTSYRAPYSVYVLSGPQDRSPRKIAEGWYGSGPGVRWSYGSDRLVAMVVDPASRPSPPPGAKGPLPTGPIWTWPGPGPGGTDLPFPPVRVRPENWKEPTIALIDPETRATTPLRLANGSPVTGMWPSWVDDDSRILYVRENAKGEREIWSYDFGTKQATRLYPFEEGEH
jgi:hypothetical protein